MLSQRAWLAGLIAAATVLFVVGVSIERSDTHHSVGASAKHVESREGEAGEHAEEGEVSGHEKKSAGHEEVEEETLLGVEVEATPFIVLAALVSLGLALAAWMRPRSTTLLIVVALAMLVFAVFDVREVAHQIEESEAGLAVVAGIVAALHLAASGVSFSMRRAVEPDRKTSAVGSG